MSELPDFDSLWDYSEPAVSEQRFRALLPGPDDRGWRAELLSQIARANGLQRRFDPPFAILSEAEALIGDGDIRPRVRCLLERGRVLNTSGDPASSRALFLSAWELASTERLDFFAVDAAHMLGIVEPPEVQLDWTGRAIRLAEVSADPKARNWLGSLYNNLGWSMMDLGRFEEALEIFQKAEVFRQAQGKPVEIRVAKWCVGRALRSLGRGAEALAIQQGLHAEWDAAGGGQDGYVSEELGELLLEMGKGKEARSYFAEAHRLLSQDAWLAEHEAARLARILSLAEEN